jgi:calcineurin-like phosphoesterase family protein
LKTKHFVVADLHFGHGNVMAYEIIRCLEVAKRTNLQPSQVYEMAINKDPFILQSHNQMLIDAWNSVVGPEDVVFFLGDFCLTRNKELIQSWVSQLNGRKRLIMGNHDVRKPEFYMECGFESVSPYPVLYNNHIFLSHQPLPHEIVPKGYINFFGHVHSNTEFNWERGICVSVEQVPNFAPIPIDRYIGDWSELYPDRHKIAD